jgi:uncharacterized protein (TIGR03435 family)
MLHRNLGFPAGAAASDATDGTPVLAAALEKVGLKIEKAMVPRETLIVDRIDKAASQ